MKIDFDRDSDVAYVYIEECKLEGAVDKTIEVNNNIILDFDSNGKLVGIEALNATKNLSEELINSLVVSSESL
jgi:uncharacterized protein YuzE